MARSRCAPTQSQSWHFSRQLDNRGPSKVTTEIVEIRIHLSEFAGPIG
jgi:hypothetical protein